ncbi:SusD/RagB family nutrient-binding outer membrane lipoprotein [Sphingobacterium sp. DK4209]|uniref:SusD/RagB family nutrient-binding outer membrane lipoprotein n=1 Tax=Sphingobacterium zhuxiongii TaxID=2662364 RepID=A0A5Q0QBE7_9SPHI|nr:MULTISPECIES: RagB/SusD family nutrient uptake outer membrane protein [unclassified Sphingobacterium]MVZ66623.1 SusD/RagB family nutrient-binding outer membrane lipoprotein [Sphingobacterium sp. DK4209]QGA26806.1 SusD/RagB family nutrient-binding outer membrane lipoprotein [Sphingobacterium sp. dk4302]
MKLHKILFLGAMCSTLAFQSCTKKFDEYNTDPAGATPEEVERDAYVLSSAMIGLQSWVIPLDVNANQFIECLLGGSMGGYLADSNNGFNGKNFATYNPENGWSRVPFNDILPKLFVQTKTIKQVSQDVSVHAVAEIVKAMAASRVTDIYGPIPYSKVGENGALEAPYDSQEQVYDVMFSQLDEAIKVLTERRTQNFSSKADMVYGGNVIQWIKLANSLKLRLAIRISDVNPAKGKQKAEEAINHEIGVIRSNADNAFVKPINRNPFRIIMYEYNNGDSRVSADITSYMNGYADPRRAKYFTMSAFSGSVTNGYVGLRSGIQIPTGNIPKEYSNMNVTETDKLLWFNAAEVSFLAAEGALKGWNMAGGTAESLYNQGIRLSFEQWNVTGADDYLLNSSNKPAAYIDPNGAFSYAGVPSAITIKWQETASASQKLERIITQKWIANFPLGIEAWSEYRRTGFPKLMEVMVNNSAGRVDSKRKARRLPYPQEEYTENGKNVNEAVTNLLKGADNMGTDLWWVKK